MQLAHKKAHAQKLSETPSKSYTQSVISHGSSVIQNRLPDKYFRATKAPSISPRKSTEEAV